MMGFITAMNAQLKGKKMRDNIKLSEVKYLRRNGCHVWMLVCVLYFTVYVYVCVHCIQTDVCVFHCTALNDDVVLNKK